VFNTSSFEVHLERPNVSDVFEDSDGNIVIVQRVEGDSVVSSVHIHRNFGAEHSHLRTPMLSLSRNFEKECSQLEQLLQFTFLKEARLSKRTQLHSLSPELVPFVSSPSSEHMNRKREMIAGQPKPPAPDRPRIISCIVSSGGDHITLEACLFNPGDSKMTNVSLSFLSSSGFVTTESQCHGNFEGFSKIRLSARLLRQTVPTSCTCIQGTLAISYESPNGFAIARVGTLRVPMWTQFDRMELICDASHLSSPPPPQEYAIQSGVILTSDAKVPSAPLLPSLKRVLELQVTLPNGIRREVFAGDGVCIH
jgi:hypothetical protein